MTIFGPDHNGKRINIVYHPSSGLAVDAKVILEALAGSGLSVTLSHVQEWNSYSGRLRRLLLRSTSGILPPRYAINIFLEEVHPEWLAHAHSNVLIPNQEWCRPSTFKILSKLDAVFCKTRHAEAVFSHLLPEKVRFVGFSSIDRRDASIPQDFSRFIHIAGKSRQKGSATLLHVWARRPDWPTLTVICRDAEIGVGIMAPNIVWLNELGDSELRQMQNRSGVHLCPSEAEGFGHYIAEAMSCGALVLTTDAAPMNELVTANRGILVPFAGRKPQMLGFNYYVDEFALEAAIDEIVLLADAQKRELGARAREWFSTTKTRFAENFGRALGEVLNRPPEKQ